MMRVMCMVYKMDNFFRLFPVVFPGNLHTVMRNYMNRVFVFKVSFQNL